jgi:hypothetical protein
MTDTTTAHPAPPVQDTVEDVSTAQTTTSSAAALPAGERFQSFDDFYPFYIGEHQHPTNRRMHVVGTGIVVFCLVMVLLDGLIDGAGWLVLAPLVGYGMAWAGHYFFEKNQPATFTYPLWSLMGDFKMAWEVVTQKRAW